MNNTPDTRPQVDINFLLATTIIGGLRQLEEHHGWDLSYGEQAEIGHTIYAYIHAEERERPLEEWQYIFNAAYAWCYGMDHSCNKLTQKELDTFLGELEYQK